MLYFYVETERKAKSGIASEDFDETRLYRSLEQAQKDKRGKVFVVNGGKTPANLSGDVKKIPRRAFLNASPYLKPEEVAAGGGIVSREGKKKLKILLICRKGLWDIPKGKLDPGETIKQCAKREVKEELGIKNKQLTVLDFLDTTTHGYVSEKGDTFVVKTTFWYHMKTVATEFVPQQAEKITAVKWYSIHKAKEALGHETLVRLLNRVEHKLHHAHVSA